MKTWLKRHKLISVFLAGLLFATPSIIANHDSLIKVALAAQVKVSELTALTGSGTATDDDFLIIDTDATESKRITRNELALGLSGPMGIAIQVAPSTAASAAGTDGIAIGDAAVGGDAAGDNGAIAFGQNAVAIGESSIAIGENTRADGDKGIAIGGNDAVGIGADAGGFRSVAIGNDTDASATDSLAIGGDAVATAAASVGFGFGSNASSDNAIGIGQNTDAAGANCIAIGGNATDSDSADCSAADAVAIGQHILADDIGEFAFASGEFATQSDAHTSIYVLRGITTDGNIAEIFTDGSAGDISVPANCTNLARISIVGRQTNEDGTGAGFLITVGHANDTGTTVELAEPTVTTVFNTANASGWVVDTTADDTNDSINVHVTGSTSDTINWVARAEVVESCG